MLRMVECMLVQMVPVEVISENIAPHLSLRDLQALDTAFTNKYLRPKWADVLRSFQDSCSECDTIQLSDVQWLHEHGVIITSISLCNSSASMHDSITFICAHIKTLRQLILPEVYEYGCSDSILEQLASGCPQLEVLHIEGAHDITAGIAGQQCRNLHTVSFVGNTFSEAGIEAMCSSCPNLKHIDISSSYYLTDASLLAIANTYPHLKSINISRCDYFTDDGLVYFADKCQELRSVSVSCDDITSRGLAALWAANPNLIDVVDVSGNILVSDDDIIQLVQCCHQLQKLNMSLCNQITDAAVIAVAEHCPQLRSLDISECYGLSDASLITLGRHCHELRSIHISCLTNLSDVGIAVLAAGCPLLQEFNASNTNIANACVIAVVDHCPQLRSLDICRCINMSDFLLIALGQHCHVLKSINISYLENISDVGIAALAGGCPLLQEFYAFYANITDAGVIALARGCRDLRKIRLNYCKCVSVSAFSTITENCPHLSDINICGGQVDDAWLYVIAQHCRNLTVLDVAFSKIVEADAIRAVLESCSRLTKIDARECSKLRDKESIRNLQKKYPHVSGLLELE